MIEIIPKPAQKLPLWQNILFYFSLALLLLAILSYFILDHSLKKTSQALENLEETLAREKTSSEIILEKEVFGYQKKIRDFSQLIKEHKVASKFFEFFEGICHPKVWFSQLSLNPEESQIAVSGVAENFTILGQQLLILQKEPLIKSLNLSGISIGRGGKVNFTLNLSLDPSIFK